MCDEKVLVDARYEEWFQVDGLSMHPSLAGAEHAFEFERRKTIIRLPDGPFDAIPGHNTKAFVSRRLAATNEPVNIDIYAIQVIISGFSVKIPTAAAATPHINATLYDESERSELDGVADEMYYTARRAIDYWLRITRFRTGVAVIGLIDRLRDSTLFGGRLVNSQNNTRFYSPRIQRTVCAERRHEIDPAQWARIGDDLAGGSLPPIWHEYLMTGIQRIETGDIKAATIDLATCAELAIRRRIDKELPHGTPTTIRAKLARIKMTDIFKKWQKLGLPPRHGITKYDDIKLLFEVRNSIAHNGDDSRLSTAFCETASEAVKELLNRINP